MLQGEFNAKHYIIATFKQPLDTEFEKFSISDVSFTAHTWIQNTFFTITQVGNYIPICFDLVLKSENNKIEFPNLKKLKLFSLLEGLIQ